MSFDFLVPEKFPLTDYSLVVTLLVLQFNGNLAFCRSCVSTKLSMTLQEITFKPLLEHYLFNAMNLWIKPRNKK